MIGAYLVGLGFAGALGWMIGGRPAGIARLRMRSMWLLWLALALQLSQYVPAFRVGPAGAAHRVLLVLSYGSVALWLLRNVAAYRNLGLRIGLAVIGLGWALNAAVVVVNNGMPVSTAASQRAGAPAAFTDSALEQGDLYKHVLSTSATNLRPLGDVIPLPLLREVVSPGDVVLWLGILITVVAAMCFDGVRKGQTTGRLLAFSIPGAITDRRASKRNNLADQ